MVVAIDTSFPRWLLCCLMKTGSDEFSMNFIAHAANFKTTSTRSQKARPQQQAS
jgi:hypothetical protein